MDERDLAVASAVVRFIFVGRKEFNKDISGGFSHFLN
jgi:hypothetical protein